MDDIQFAKYSEDTREILENMTEESVDKLVRNVVAYAISNNNCKTNWIARELFVDVIEDNLITEIFDEY